MCLCFSRLVARDRNMIDGSQERNFKLRSKFQSFHVIEKRSKRCLFSVVPWI